MCEIYLRYFWNMPKISLRYAGYMPEISLRYAWDMPEIFLRYAWDMPEIFLRYSEMCLRNRDRDLKTDVWFPSLSVTQYVTKWILEMHTHLKSENMNYCSVATWLSRCEHLGSLVTTEQFSDIFFYLFNKQKINLNFSQYKFNIRKKRETQLYYFAGLSGKYCHNFLSRYL